METKLNLRIAEEDKSDLQELADAEGMKLGTYVRRELKKLINIHKTKKEHHATATFKRKA